MRRKNKVQLTYKDLDGLLRAHLVRLGKLVKKLGEVKIDHEAKMSAQWWSVGIGEKVYTGSTLGAAIDAAYEDIRWPPA